MGDHHQDFHLCGVTTLATIHMKFSQVWLQHR